MYFLSFHEDETSPIASKEASSQKGQSSVRGGIMERTLQEGLIREDPYVGNPETEEDAEVFVASVLTVPSADVTGSSKVTSKKCQKISGKGAKRNSKKVKVPTISEGTEGAKEASPTEPGVRDYQTLEGFRRRTTTSVITKDKLLLFKVDKALTPSQVNYKAIVPRKSLMKRVLGFEGPTITPSLPRGATPSSYEKSDQVDQTATSKVFLDLTSDKEDALQPSSSLPKVFNTSPQDPSSIQEIWYPSLPLKSGTLCVGKICIS
ncbi:hypothetical protein LIER_01929 [Lithospermum erythrorhizon]|uniref:Uncharacterized protein n=1 Tax=Lithospermum erythrorhizon TaxID=34254 RepID=A0AAV3NMN1_LITER